MEHAIATVPVNAGSPTLAAIGVMSPGERLASWLATLSANTARGYTRDLMHLAQYLRCDTPGKALEALCASKHATAVAGLEAYRDGMLAAGLSSATINRRLSAVNSALAELAKADHGHGRLAVKPVPHEARRDTRGPGISKIARVVEETAERAIEGDVTAARDLAIVLLAAQRGLRRAEIASLSLDQLRLDDRTLFVRRKGKREMVSIEIADTTAEALGQWLTHRNTIAAQDTAAVFVATGNKWRGKPIGTQAMYEIVRKAGASVGAKWHPHGLRHSAITEALRLCNGSLVAAQTFAGHSSSTTTGRYIDDKARLERQAVDAMGSVFTLPTRS